MSCLRLRTPIRVILFDLVGTLVEPAVPVGETYASAAARHGVRVDPEVVTKNFHRALSCYHYRPRATVPSDGDDRVYWKEIIAESLAISVDSLPGRQEEIAEELYAHYGHGGAWRLYPEVQGVLSALRSSGLGLGVFSNWDGRARRVLADLGLNESFRAIFLSAEMGAAKPDPYVYRLVAERLGLPPAELLLVGDDPESDGTAPRSSGYASWVLRRPETNLERVSPAWLESGLIGS